jgi:hypothetical protein
MLDMDLKPPLPQFPCQQDDQRRGTVFAAGSLADCAVLRPRRLISDQTARHQES